jgi:hypothetical protein
MLRRTFGIFAALLTVAAMWFSGSDRLAAAEFTAEQTARGVAVFKNDLRKLLAHQCLDCHGGTETESKFDISTRAALLKGGKKGLAIIPGNAEKSRLYRLITHAEKPHMPEDQDKLPDAAIAKIRDWINDGAPYDKPLLDPSAKGKPWQQRPIAPDARDYWAFLPLAKSAPPTVKNMAWCKTTADRFVVARLESKGLAPSASVTKRQLARRLYLDLIGLPPTPEEIDAFEKDTDPQATAKLADRLLASPHYGEKWARHWLDVARFAESHGFEHDYDRKHAFHYRDFVIRAFNQDLPYDQFVRWQLAGDEIEPDNPLALMATGFLGAGVFPTQITANEVERVRYDALDDMAATMGTAMLGLTIGCAKCHDHKFDPIPQGDYYRLLSAFTTTVRTEINLDVSGGDPKAMAAHKKKHTTLKATLAEYEKKQLAGNLATWEKARGASSAKPKWQVLDVITAKSKGGATLKKQPDGSILASGKNPSLDTYTFTANVDQRNITAIRVQPLAHPSMVRGGPGRAKNGNFALTDVQVTAAPKSGGKPVRVKLANAKATFSQRGLDVRRAIDADAKSAWAIDPQFGKDHAAVFETVGQVGFDGGTLLTITLKFQNNVGHNFGRTRLSVTTAARPVNLKGNALPQNIAAVLSTPPSKRNAKQTATLLTWYRSIDAKWQQIDAQVTSHAKQRPSGKKQRVMICSEGLKPMRHHTQGADFFKETYYLRRGDTNQKEGVAKLKFLQVLSRAGKDENPWHVDPPKGWRTSYRRRSLANWITDTEKGPGHLLARVIVNRLWQHHFGRGIVATPDDFGRQGLPPTHPALLDYLAGELIRGGWRLKPIHKLLVTSAVYAQSTQHDAAKSKIDPENTWHWRRTPRRLEAEVIRDSMLAISGQLDRKMFGAGTLNEASKRRSIYFTVKRSKLISTMQIFDAPEALVGVGARPSTTVAPQALLFMNNVHVRGYAKALAAQLAKQSGDSTDVAIRQGYLITIGRTPTDTEKADLTAFLASQTASYTAAKKANARELALTDLCQTLMSLNEFIYAE